MVRSLALVILFLTLIPPTVAGAANPKDMPTYWRESGLAISDVQRLVSEYNCQSSKENFLGCVGAVNALLAAAPAPKVLIPENSGGVLKPLPKPKTTGDVLVELATTKRERQERLKLWLALFEKGAAISFDSLIEKAEAELADPELKAQHFADAINSYYSAAKDPHTYIVPRAYQENHDPVEFSGIGVDLHIVQGQMVVIKPKPGSPAFEAGIRANDVIQSVDGVEMAGLTLDDAVKHIRGPIGSAVHVVLLRRERKLELTIARKTISNPNVTSRVASDRGLPVGFVRLNTFDTPAACAEVRNAVQELLKQNVTSLVLDLRDNLGGLVDQAVCVASLFVGPWQTVAFLYAKDIVQSMMGMEMTMHYSDYQYFPQYTLDPALTYLPLVVLINGYSASASEILSGALQDLQRATVIGERSYGKGTFQQPISFEGNANVVLMSTGGRFYLPTKRTNQIVGIQPDLTVYKSPHPSADDIFALREEDLYTNAFPPQGEPWTQPHPEQIASLKRCIDSSGLAEKSFEAHKSEPIPADYQLLYAEDALSCMLR